MYVCMQKCVCLNLFLVHCILISSLLSIDFVSANMDKTLDSSNLSNNDDNNDNNDNDNDKDNNDNDSENDKKTH